MKQNIIINNKIKNQVYEGVFDGAFCIIKLKPYSPTPLNSVKQFIFGNNSLTFLTELMFNKKLNTCQEVGFLYPNLLFYDNNVIIYERVKQLPFESNEAKNVAEPILEFNLNNTKPDYGFFQRFVLYFLHSPSAVLIKGGVELLKCWELKVFIKYVKYSIKCGLSTFKAQKHILLHNDLGDGNILKGQDSNIYIIDFSSVTNERKWLLVDIIHYCLQYNSESKMGYDFRFDVAKEYMKRFTEKYQFLYEQINLEDQFKIGVLVKLMKDYLSGKKNKKIIVNFIKHDYANKLWNMMLEKQGSC